MRYLWMQWTYSAKLYDSAGSLLEVFGYREHFLTVCVTSAGVT